MTISVRTNELAIKEDFWNSHPVSLAMYKGWEGLTDNLVGFHSSIIRGATEDKPLGYMYDAVLLNELLSIPARYRYHAAQIADGADVDELDITEEEKRYLQFNVYTILAAKEEAMKYAGSVQALKAALKNHSISLAEFAEIYSWRGGERLFGLNEAEFLPVNGSA